MPDEYVDLEYDLHRVEAHRGVLELAVRQLRAYAGYITANKAEADEMVEDTLMLFLAEDRSLRHCGTCFTQLLDVFRKVHGRAARIQASRNAPDGDYAAFLMVPLPEREVVALMIGGGMSATQSAALLGLTPADVQILFENACQRLGPARLPEWPFVREGANDYPLAGDGDMD